ncbi:YceI family protein [Chloroherpeton thalassium ATCC 35110]|uniref:YceI family protein n=1 Tax=Chloroherpeton thalassium (strain ATCC 35110 / GB-78) TaxID=517418 RepID=B3QSX8_CHLT3|nr:YceI family protein [Chloroherpeton thalassium]ACF12621.1 YceI family protein [Chloroherpeton thalassium ATCC 35110]
MKKVVFALVFLFTASKALFAADVWSFDKAHSNVRFSVSHLVITDVEGAFKSYDGKVVSENEDFSGSKINFTIDVASIDTDNEKRDEHLKAADFFNADKYPHITFESKSFEKVSGKKYKLVGDLTIKGVTKEVALEVIYNGTVNSPMGGIKAGFKITGEINRFDYGLEWNKLMETGGAIIGETVSITCNIELNKEA